MSFAIIYACHKLLEHSRRNDETNKAVSPNFVHDEPIKGRKRTINSLRKKFNKTKRGGSSL